MTASHSSRTKTQISVLRAQLEEWGMELVHRAPVKRNFRGED